MRRLETLENVESIKQVKARYACFVEERRYEELEALFTLGAKVMSDGATWDSGADLANVVRDFVSAAPAVHHGHMPEIQITGPDTAPGIWAMEDTLAFPAGKDAPECHDGYGQYRETWCAITQRNRLT